MKRVWLILVVAIIFVGFLWPTPYLTVKGGAGIAIGAFWPMMFYSDEGLPMTAAAVIWMIIGMVVGLVIGYLSRKLMIRRGLGFVALIAAWIAGLVAAKLVFDSIAQVWRQPLGFWRFLVLIVLAIIVWSIPIGIVRLWLARRNLGSQPSGALLGVAVWVLVWVAAGLAGWAAYARHDSLRLPIAILAGASAWWAVGQARMVLAYLGIVPSNVGPAPVFVPIAFRAVLKYSLFCVVLILFRWPTLITYILAVLLFTSLLDWARLRSAAQPEPDDKNIDGSRSLANAHNRTMYRNGAILYGTALVASALFIGF